MPSCKCEPGDPAQATSTRLLRWLGHVRRMDDGRLTKDILFEELATGQRATGSPHLRFKDLSKRDLEAPNIDVDSWEERAGDRSTCRQELSKGLKRGMQNFRRLAKGQRRRKRKTASPASRAERSPSGAIDATWSDTPKWASATDLRHIYIYIYMIFIRRKFDRGTGTVPVQISSTW